MNPVPEKSVQNEIRSLLEHYGWMTHHLEVFSSAVVDYDGRKRRFTEGTPGQADLIAVRPAPVTHQSPLCRARLCEALYIEVKRRGSKSKKHQVAWQEVRRRDGFIVLSDCRSWADVVGKAKEAGVEVERR